MNTRNRPLCCPLCCLCCPRGGRGGSGARLAGLCRKSRERPWLEPIFGVPRAASPSPGAAGPARDAERSEGNRKERDSATHFFVGRFGRPNSRSRRPPSFPGWGRCLVGARLSASRGRRSEKRPGPPASLSRASLAGSRARTGRTREGCAWPQAGAKLHLNSAIARGRAFIVRPLVSLAALVNGRVSDGWHA